MQDDRVWNDDMIARAVHLFNVGHGATHAAYVLSNEFRRRLSRSAVMGKWNRLGLRRNPYDPAVPRLKRKSDGTKDKRKDSRPRKRPKELRVKADVPGMPVDKYDDVDSRDPLHTVGRPLQMIRNASCRFSVASDGPKHLMCGAPGHPWCQRHAAIVFAD